MLNVVRLYRRARKVSSNSASVERLAEAPLHLDHRKADCFTSGTAYSGTSTSPSKLRVVVETAAEAIKSAAGVASAKAGAATEELKAQAGVASAKAGAAKEELKAEARGAGREAEAQAGSTGQSLKSQIGAAVEEVKGQATNASYTAQQVKAEAGKAVNNGEQSADKG